LYGITYNTVAFPYFLACVSVEPNLIFPIELGKALTEKVIALISFANLTTPRAFSLVSY
jgi:hypothetical protein